MISLESSTCFLGIDIGSVSLGCVLIDEQGIILQHGYCFHRGNILRALRETLAGIDLSRVCQVGYNQRACDFFSEGFSINDQVAIIDGARFQQQDIDSLFVIGGETFGLILFNEKHQYKKYVFNSSCAAGTGAFLDQQAERLGLSGSAELSCLAEHFEGEPPKIATRCAVFAKTDLIHCQQQGYSIEAISAGLCQGLARNIFDTLHRGGDLREPVVAVGGVSRNTKVMQYLSEMIGYPIHIPEHAVLAGAIGCALNALDRGKSQPLFAGITADTLLKVSNQEKHYFYPPLLIKKSTFPDFYDHTHYISQQVEVDAYDPLPKKEQIPAYLGIDIGSTSTKAVIVNPTCTDIIWFGLYTRTKGQPIQATQALLRSLSEIERLHGIRFDFQGVGTTGSGRKFIQKVIHADLAIDEISAHARAAYALNSNVDTIIEIGGQDSKFTVMNNGSVTFSVMNYVCAAGTGSFIEEQARRLNVPLHEYASRAINIPAPLTSDRCTVFMERDLNHLLSRGYSIEELLAAALHSVADNYLSKVAHISKIGQVICFQGATAKNEALVAVFEQKLQKPILVSKYCHLMGSLGVCLLLSEKDIHHSHFRGIDFYRQTTAVSEQVCELCNNHCKLKKVTVGDETMLWGFMCGRDEADSQRKNLNLAGFDLLSNRRKIFTPPAIPEIVPEDSNENISETKSVEARFLPVNISIGKLRDSLNINLLNLRHKLFTIRQDEFQGTKSQTSITIGIPNTLYMLDGYPFWEFFFNKLGYHVFRSNSRKGFIELGKEVAGAEFCTPISCWHGHVQYTKDHCDYLFLPEMIQEKENGKPMFYCYYSNYAVALIRNIPVIELGERCISPQIDFSLPALYNVHQIYSSLPQHLKLLQTPSEIQEAYIQAWHWFKSRREMLSQIFDEQYKQLTDISVVLLGRPYLILDPVMNQNIHRLFNELGVKTFFQDMLPKRGNSLPGPEDEFIEWNHWKFGANILQGLEYIGQTPGVYPVYLSAFKCSPDSFVIHYFKEIMDSYQKPYLILQIDEHGSDIGYGTRVESAVETFRTHFHQSQPVSPPAQPRSMSPFSAKQKAILVPNYDPISCDLICAAFEHAGYRAHLIEETPMTVVSSLRLNDGQCLPISSIIQGAVETIQKHHLRVDDTAIFLNAITQVACNFPQYPLIAKKILEQMGDGFEKVQVFATDFSMIGLPFELILDVYQAYLLGGLLRQLGCRLRPYEKEHGQVDRIIEAGRQKLHHCIAEGLSKESDFAEIVKEFQELPLQEKVASRPKVAIVGDLYVRDNDVFNQQLISGLESFGAEVVTVPFNYIIRLNAENYMYSLSRNGNYLPLLPRKLLMEVAEKVEMRFYQIANSLLNEEFPTFDSMIFDCLEHYKLSFLHGGETAQNILKIFSLLKHYPDITLFVHVNPIFCCPGLVSESLFKTIEKDIGIPIVSIVYDGTSTNKNDVLAPYLHYIQKSVMERSALASR